MSELNAQEMDKVDDRMDCLRGRYIARVIDVESRIDNIISMFFQVIDRGQLFQNWLITHIHLTPKIQFLRQITRELKINSEYEELMGALEAIAVRRNQMAHRPFPQVIEIGDEGEKPLGIHVYKRKRKGLDAFDHVDLDDLEAEIE